MLRAITHWIEVEGGIGASPWLVEEQPADLGGGCAISIKDGTLLPWNKKGLV